MDPTMQVAFEIGRERSTTSDLPASLADLDARARLVSETDPPAEWTTDVTRDRREWSYSHIVSADSHRIRLLARIAPALKEAAARLLPDVADEDARLSICLRLWAGCLDGAKIIALGTKLGPNTPESRPRDHAATVAPRAAIDPIYAAGAEAALAFKRLRNQETCFDGVPLDSILRVRD
jgi:hypothetical protein